MAQTILICGKTGTGKTSAIRTLNPKETVIMKVINRTLPFKYTGYSKELGNLFHTPSYTDIIKGLDWVNKKQGVKNVVITDATYIIRQEFFARSKEKGYDRFTDFAVHMQQVITKAQSLRDDIKVFIEYHVDSVTTDTGVIEYKPATIGKLLDAQYNILENMDIVLFASPTMEDKSVKYGFYTNRALDRSGAEMPAKSPMEMFNELFIPNDLQYVADHIDKYYGQE